ncbi:MAG: regulatory protein SipA [Leptolyngbyaceae cyanobacterium]
MPENIKSASQDGAVDDSMGSPTTEPTSDLSATEPKFAVGDRVCICKQPPYFKTADTMPMLRPPDTIPVGTEGQITGRKPGGYWIVRFPKGSFLLDSQYIQAIT